MRLRPLISSWRACATRALGREDRMRVGDRAQDLRRIDRLRAVQRHAELAVGVERLQAVHVVGDRRHPARLGQQVVVPARPGAAAAREHAAVGVQDGLVGLVGDRAEDLVLAVGRVGEHRQRLVGVRREHDLVEALGLSPARRQQRHGPRRRVIDVIGVSRRSRSRQRTRHGVDVGARAAGRPSATAGAWRSRASRGWRRSRPGSAPGTSTSGADRPTTRPTPAGTISLLDERLRVAALVEPVAQRRAFAAVRQQRPRVAVEAHEVGDHAVKPGRHEVRALGEQPVGRRAVVLEVAAVGDPEAHVRRLGRRRRATRAGARSSDSCGR